MLADEDPDILQDAVTHVSKARQTSGQSRSSTEHKVRKTLKMWRLKGTTVTMKQGVTRRRMKNIPRINQFSPSRCPPYGFRQNLHDWMEKEHIHNPTINFKQNRSRNHGYADSSPPRTKLSIWWNMEWNRIRGQHGQFMRPKTQLYEAKNSNHQAKE